MAKKKKVSIATQSVAVEDVTGRHRTLCATCNEFPQGKRLVIKKGSGKWVKTKTYCRDCSEDALDEIRDIMDNMSIAMGKKGN